VAPVEWTVISGEQAETLLANLTYNEHPTTQRVRPSQGDYGIDLLIPVGECGEPFDVHQIKKFADNLGDSEKRQIKNSFRRFLVGVGRRKVPAADWYLVMPIDPTVDNYLTWFLGMPGEVIKEMFADGKLALTDDEKQRITAWRDADGRKIEWKGRTHCDNLAAKYPFVVDYYVHGGQQTIRDAVKDVAALLKTDASLHDSADADTVALATPAELYGHLAKLQSVLDTDPHYRYGVSLDPTPPEIVEEPDLVAASQVTQEDGQTVTFRIYRRFAEALNERPIELKLKFLVGHATFDQQAFEMWRKYGKALTAPAEVEADLPGGLGGAVSGQVAQVSIGAVGENFEARLRIRRPDGTTGDPLPFSLTMTSGTAGDSGQGTDQAGFLTVDIISDRETRIGTWQIKRKGCVGAEVMAVLPSIEFLHELHAPNVLQIAQKYGQFEDYAEIPLNDDVYPDAFMDYLRALAIIQTATATPVLIPDVRTITVGEVEAVIEAVALVSGQTVVVAWDSLAMAADASVEEAGPEQEIDFASEYQLLEMKQLVVAVGEQNLVLGTVSKLALSARYEIDDGNLVARPYRNDSLQKNFSPLPDAAEPFYRHVLGKKIGQIDDPVS
jgi:hypothetical protein